MTGLTWSSQAVYLRDPKKWLGEQIPSWHFLWTLGSPASTFPLNEPNRKPEGKGVCWWSDSQVMGQSDVGWRKTAHRGKHHIRVMPLEDGSSSIVQQKKKKQEDKIKSIKYGRLVTFCFWTAQHARHEISTRSRWVGVRKDMLS